LTLVATSPGSVPRVPPDASIEALPAIIARRSDAHGDRVWLQDVLGDSATYVEAQQRSRRWASALAGIGVGVGDRVATLLSNSVDSVLTWLGIAQVGAIEAPVHPAFTGYMLEHTINTVGAEVVIVEAARLTRVLDALPQVPTVRLVVVVGGDGTAHDSVVASEDLLRQAGGPVETVDLHAWDPAAIIFTSGTTGPSKGVVTPWGVIRCTAQRTFPYDDLDADDAVYVFTPASHIGAKVLPYLAAMLGGRAVMRADFKIGSFLDDIRQWGITTTPAVGAIPHFLVQMPEQPDDRDIPLRNMVMAPLVPDLDDFRQRFGVRICTAYSMTELSIPFASVGWDVDNHGAVGKHIPGWPGIQVRLVDDHDREVAAGEVGELIVRSDEPWTLNSGYYGMADATANAWRNGWYHSGDAFRRDEEGYYYFVDRVKDCIRRRGENISSFEVETIVNQFPGVGETAAVGVPADEGEDEVKVFVVPTDPNDPPDPQDLTDFLISRMPRFMIPRYIEVVDDLAKTVGTLRLKKQELRERGNTAATWDRVAAGMVLPRT